MGVEGRSYGEGGSIYFPGKTHFCKEPPLAFKGKCCPLTSNHGCARTYFGGFTYFQGFFGNS